MASKKELSFNLGIGTSASSTIEDQEVLIELNKLYNALNLVAFKLDEYTGAIPVSVEDRPYVSPSVANRAAGINRFYGKATVSLVTGALVKFNVSSELELATSGAGVHCIVLEDTAATNYAPVSRCAVLTAFAGLIPGTQYAVSTTVPGGIMPATSVPSGQIRRIVGFAINSTTLAFYPDNIGVTV